MVSLTRIYTRTGDTGTTHLGDGSPVAKTHPRVAAMGGVDELNAVLGLALACGVEAAHGEVLRRVQNELFDAGADLSVPLAGEAQGRRLRLGPGAVAALEKDIDGINAGLGALRSFVLPGGQPAAAWLHLARTVCRRAERQGWVLATQEAVNPHVLSYLNRLSDLLFVLARAANGGGEGDVLWEPGKTQQGGPA
ncbi:MAG: cob(I)yrinic acid a,c-diamide adenosyltransferase [Candidatus Latescibacterota bacterium]